MFEIVEYHDSWKTALKRARVELIQIDFRLGLRIANEIDSAQIFIETPFLLREKDSNSHINPADSKALAPILCLFNSEVVGIESFRNGVLQIRFGDGIDIEVQPHALYEAWQVSYSGKFMLICQPGGTVSIFNRR